MDALGKNLIAARSALEQLHANPNDPVAQDNYNFATARVFGILRDAKLSPWEQPLPVPTQEGTILLSHQPDPRPQWNPELYTFIPADQFDIKGAYVSEQAARPGVGAPLVAIGKDINPGWQATFGLRRVYYGVTAVLKFKGDRCVIEFLDPLDHETVSLDGRTFPLAANFTLPMAVLLNENASKASKIARMFFPERYSDTARLVRLEPYNPNKTVVLVIHGLMDSPTTWTPMIINLRNDPEIRKHILKLIDSSTPVTWGGAIAGKFGERGRDHLCRLVREGILWFDIEQHLLPDTRFERKTKERVWEI